MTTKNDLERQLIIEFFTTYGDNYRGKRELFNHLSEVIHQMAEEGVLKKHEYSTDQYRVARDGDEINLLRLSGSTFEFGGNPEDAVRDEAE